MSKQYLYLQEVEIALEDLRDADSGRDYEQRQARNRIIRTLMDCLDPMQFQMVQGGNGPTLWDARLMALQVALHGDSSTFYYISIPRWFNDAMLAWYAAWDVLPDWRKWPDEFLPPCVTCGKTVSDGTYSRGLQLCDDCLKQAHEDLRADIKLEEEALARADKGKLEV